MEMLFDAGARDVFYTPIFMKKNRPAYMLTVLVTEEKAEDMERIIFQNTTGIGIRRQVMERTILKRKAGVLPTPYGEVRVKICDIEGAVRVYPEYESVAEISRRTGLAFQYVLRMIIGEIQSREWDI